MMEKTTGSQAAKVALVTGGAQGIGKGIAAGFLAAGWAVAITDIDPEAGEETVSALAPHGEIAFFRGDAGVEDDARACVVATLARFGRLDALVNNAGIAGAPRTPVEELSLAEWDRMIRSNLTGAFLMAKHAVPHLRATRGTIVNIASTRALQSEAHTEAYSASKGGLVALTHALSVSLGPDIRVNCVSPGWIDTSGWKKRSRRKQEALRPEDHAQHPAGRVGTPEDIAAMVLFLVSDGAGFVTGQNFVVDGGMTRKMIYAP
jgi:NAD(P)-dependent dehydrogenase (short-subunit alcohol dehydrogenase family)